MKRLDDVKVCSEKLWAYAKQEFHDWFTEIRPKQKCKKLLRKPEVTTSTFVIP